MPRRYRGYGAAPRFRGRPKPMEPVTIPTLPSYEFPKRPGMGRFTHWTEARVRDSVMAFAREVLGFERPVVYRHFRYTGNVDMVAVDKGVASEPCARFEIKAAQEYITDIHAKRGARRRRPPRRKGRFEINPAQHFQSGAGACNLFYVLVPVRGKRTIEHVGICTLPMIEDALDVKIRVRRAIHRDVAFACPGVKDWIRWKRGG